MRKLLSLALLLALCLFALPALAAPGDADLLRDSRGASTETIHSGAVVGETLYLLTDQWLSSYKAGDADVNPQLAVADAWNPALSAGKQLPVALLSDGEKLLGLNGDGQLGTWDGAAFTWGQALELDGYTLLPNASNSLTRLTYADGAIYALLSAQADSSGLVNGGMELLRFDAATGERETLPTANLWQLCAYKPGQLLGVQWDMNAISGNTIPPSEIVIVDSQSGALLGSAGKLSAYGDGGVAYDAAADTIYAISGGQVVRSVAGAAFEPANYLSTQFPMMSATLTAALPGGYYALADHTGLAVRNADPQYLSNTPLRIRGLQMDDAMVRKFMQANPDIPVVMEQSMDITSEALKTALTEPGSTVDILALYTFYGLEPLKQKGYLEDLSAVPGLAEAVGKMYPQLQDSLGYQGKIYAVPGQLLVGGWMVDTQAMAEFGFELPRTMNEYYQLLSQWQADFADDNTDYQLSRVVLGKAGLFSSALYDYSMAYGTPDAPLKLDTPAFREVLQTITDSSFEDVDLNDMSGVQMYMGGQEKIIIDNNSYDMFNSYTRRDEDGKPACTLMPPPPFEENGPPSSVMAQMMVYVVNPNSANKEAALKFMQFALENMADETRVAATPDLNDPVEDPDYQEGIVRLQKSLDEKKAALSTAPEADQQAIKDGIAEMEKAMANSEQYRYSITAEGIAAYRQLAPHMNLMTDSPLMNVDNQQATQELNDIIIRYLNSQLSMDQMLRELDKKFEMMYLEGN